MSVINPIPADYMSVNHVNQDIHYLLDKGDIQCDGVCHYLQPVDLTVLSRFKPIIRELLGDVFHVGTGL